MSTSIDYSGYWQDQRKSYGQALEYLKGRRKGTITSYITPWPKVNDAGVDGLEWQSTTIIAGRPGSGKTLIKDQIIREGFKLNKGAPIRVLEFSLDMVAKANKIREFCSVLGKSYQYVCSAGENNQLSKEDLQKLVDHSNAAMDIDKYPVDIIEKAPTVTTFGKIVEAYMKKHIQVVPDPNNPGKTMRMYTNTVITVDHSYLLKTEKGQGKTDMLYALGEMLTVLKKKYPIAFIVLSQLNKGTETYERNEDGKYGNYILEGDILGGDALLQNADLVIGINRPAMKYIQFYGPDRYIIDNENILVFHFLKTRMNDIRMSFFEAQFDKMEVAEADTPGQQEMTISTK